MSQAGETFFTIIGCMDGRCQEALVRLGRKTYAADFPDTITEAGVVGHLAKNPIDPHLNASIKFKVVDVSLNKHHSKGILVSGHQECAGHQVLDERQIADIIKSTEVIRKMVKSAVPVYGVFVSRDKSGKWIAKIIDSPITS